MFIARSVIAVLILFTAIFSTVIIVRDGHRVNKYYSKCISQLGGGSDAVKRCFRH